MFCGLVDKKLAIVDYKNVDLKKSKLFHFFKGVSPWFLVKFWKFCSFFFLKKTKKIGQKKLFCKLVDRKLPILDYINNELRKFKILHFFKGVRAWFLVKNKKLCPFFFFSKKGQKKVFYLLFIIFYVLQAREGKRKVEMSSILPPPCPCRRKNANWKT